MGLTIAEDLRAALHGMDFSDQGLIETVGPGSFQTSLEGVYAVGALVNGGASVVQCIAEGRRAAERWLANA
jgi:NADPH-dependent glutamate synthase beta subunit-like oxidoreductase